MKGYSSRFIKAIEAADTSKLGVQLAKVCIAKDIPVTDVADFLGYSYDGLQLVQRSYKSTRCPYGKGTKAGC
jgi:hypothetical protein